MHRTLILLLFCTAFISCEKELDIQPLDVGETLAVDASIENGQPPQVILTKSFKYFNTLSLADLADAFVNNAKVTISDGTTTAQLKEYALPAGLVDSIYYYSVDDSPTAVKIFGQLNKSYTLNIETDGKTYTSSTTIPNINRTIDSLWWKKAPENKDTNKVVVFARLTDPPGRGNYVRYYTSRNDSAFLPGFNSVFDDAVVDGVTYDIQVDKGIDRNQEFDREEYGFFLRGDTVDVKMSNIDKTTFDFWRTWETNQSNVGNPFSVPVKVLGNISNGGLGYFGGYASQVKRIIVPK